MSFLKKLGQIARVSGKVAIYAAGYGETLKAFTPDNVDRVIDVVQSDLSQIAGIVQTIEIAGQTIEAGGPMKLQMAAPLVAQAIAQSAILAKHKIADPVLFAQGCSKVADGMADILNSLEDKVETIDKA